MDPDRWNHLKELFHAALQLDPAERHEFVARSCGEDSQLQATLESLLEHSLETGSSFDQSVIKVVDLEGAIPTSLDLLGHNLGQYRIIEKIGEGGMGEVFRAEDTQLGRPVAIKILPETFTRDPERMARFEREALILASLNHPSIETIHGLEETTDTRFLILELLEGETLRARLEKGPLPIKDLVRFGSQIAEGLTKAHEAGVVHRDLKPDNLMLTRDGFVKILDFGLAKSTSPSEDGDSRLPTEPDLRTDPGRVMGTSTYMSPEQARGEEVDHRSDQFAFGSVLYEMAIGERAFGGETDADTMVAIMRHEPNSSKSFNLKVPLQLRQIVERCLAKNREDRYESTRDLAQDLRDLSERPAELGTRASRGRHWPMRWLGAILLTGALIATGVLWWQSRGETTEELAVDARAVTTDRDREQPLESASIAVLPLESLGPAAEEYFADGMTDALITHLSRIKALKVISRTTVMQYRDTQKSMSEIARELGVETVLVGSVLHGGDRVRISTQLIDANTDQSLWAESYERDLSDILVLQSEVAQAVADAVKVETQPDEEARISAFRTVEPQAHDAYLRGLAEVEKASHGSVFRTEALRASFDHFQRAIEIEPDWAQPYAKLSISYHWLASVGGVGLQAEFYPKAKAAALQAIELDESVAQAHASLGWVLLNHEWDWVGAEQAHHRSMELDPNLSSWHYARFLQSAGYYDAAIDQFKRARERAPTNRLLESQLGRAYLCASRFDEAEAVARSVIDSNPEGDWSVTLLGRILLRTSRAEEAVQVLSKPRKLDPTSQAWTLSLRGIALAEAGELQQARETLLLLEEMGFDWMPGLYLALGEQDKAMSQIEAGFAARRDVLMNIRCSHAYERLMEIPRFREIIEAIGFPA